MLATAGKRVLARPVALAAAGLLAVGATALPAQAAPAAAGRGGQGGVSALQPASSEWWFTSWDIQTRVWPLSQGAGVKVGILDTGVQANLPDLRGTVLPGGDTTGAGGNGETDTDASAEGHGTAMASLIVGQGADDGLVGIAPKAKILPVRMGSAHGQPEEGTSQTEAAAIKFAVSRGVMVINMSIGGVNGSASGCDPVLQDAVAYALQHNVIVVASAGDEATEQNPPESPASCQGVLAVGAVNPNLTLWSGSEVQPYVAVAAPGSDITALSSNGKYFNGMGTSASAAFVSGAVALIRSRYPSMPWYQVVQRIINTSLPKGGTIPNNSFGYGIVRIDRALNVSKYPVPASDPNPVYDAYQQWLSSPQGQAYAHPAKPRPAHSAPAATGASSGSGVGVLAVVIAVVVVVVIAVAVFVVAARRRSRRPA
jgi:type VII secretion-associated serine protease mycosin